MDIKYKKTSTTLTVFVYGELDECSASNAKNILDKILLDNLNISKVVFDLSGLSFMDSTGIGMLLGRYNKFSKQDISIYIKNPTSYVNRIFEMTGIYQIIPKVC